ncbi:hypothetical protein B0T14DRAFT_282838 [Immersiella caudata]|uniref:Uncharacterized protein n=1 Tax=Immersiella caudata TaxID=314043 RepID=A0AA39WDZ5_9PEZI|nr:hypothetical protein B0T14DRAFT_282838 [Immersiella caudata]
MTKHLSAGLNSRPSGKNNDATKGSRNANDGSPDKQLACPVRAGRPHHYANVTRHCKASQVFRDVSKLMEHIERVHSPFRRCGRCWKDFPTATRSSLERDMQAHGEDCSGKIPDEKEQETRHTVIPEAQYNQVRNWSKESKKHSKGDKGGAILRHYGVICDIINSKQTPILDTQQAQPMSIWEGSAATTSGQPRSQRQRASSAGPAGNYPTWQTPLLTIDPPPSGDAVGTGYAQYYVHWASQTTRNPSAFLKAATTSPYSLDGPHLQPEYRNYAIDQSPFSASSSGPPSMAHSDGSASTGFIPPPSIPLHFVQRFDMENSGDGTKFISCIGDHGYGDSWPYRDNDGGCEPDIHLHQFAEPSLSYGPPLP